LDVIAAARYLHQQFAGKVPVTVVGREQAAVLAAYAALLEPELAGIEIDRPPLSHMSAGAPQLLNVLRVCDVAEVLGMMAPRPLKMRGAAADLAKKVAAIYTAADARHRLELE
jgi:hypothetical protein